MTRCQPKRQPHPRSMVAAATVGKRAPVTFFLALSSSRMEGC